MRQLAGLTLGVGEGGCLPGTGMLGPSRSAYSVMWARPATSEQWKPSYARCSRSLFGGSNNAAQQWASATQQQQGKHTGVALGCQQWSRLKCRAVDDSPRHKDAAVQLQEQAAHAWPMMPLSVNGQQLCVHPHNSTNPTCSPSPQQTTASAGRWRLKQARQTAHCCWQPAPRGCCHCPSPAAVAAAACAGPAAAAHPPPAGAGRRWHLGWP